MLIPKGDGIADESSNLNGNPNNAVDGNYAQSHLYNHQVCTHTLESTDSWWEYTFNFELIIHSVAVYGRDNDFAIARLNNATVQVFDGSKSNFQLCGDMGIMDIHKKIVVCANPLRGRGVRITKFGSSSTVSICEIDFYGVKLS